MRKGRPILVDGWLVQQVLMHRSPPEVKTITEACKLLANGYGVTPETLRCYASSGIPERSKLVRKMLDDYAKVEAHNSSEIFKINEMENELLGSLARVAESFAEASRTLESLKNSIERRERRA
jgi:hypothetical protein